MSVSPRRSASIKRSCWAAGACDKRGSISQRVFLNPALVQAESDACGADRGHTYRITAIVLRIAGCAFLLAHGATHFLCFNQVTRSTSSAQRNKLPVPRLGQNSCRCPGTTPLLNAPGPINLRFLDSSLGFVGPLLSTDCTLFLSFPAFSLLTRIPLLSGTFLDPPFVKMPCGLPYNTPYRIYYSRFAVALSGQAQPS